MSLTNYTENEREVVKDMFRIAGIPFTGHLTKENTHLICKRYSNTVVFVSVNAYTEHTYKQAHVQVHVYCNCSHLHIILFILMAHVFLRPEGKKYEKALEWGVPVVNGTFLAEIIHNGQVPVVLYPRHTNLGQPDEFSPGSCFEAVRLLSKGTLCTTQSVDTFSFETKYIVRLCSSSIF